MKKTSVNNLGKSISLIPLAILAQLCALLSPGYCQWQTPIQSQGPLKLGQSVVTTYDNGGYINNVVKVIDTRNVPPFNGASQLFPNEFVGPDWTENNMGNVFGIALDDSPNPNIFVSRSTVFCYLDYILRSDSALVYRLDGGNWGVSTYVRCRNIPGPPQINVNWIPNTGPGLGNLCFDKWHQQIFITNHEDGRIYRIKDNAGTGQVKSFYDPLTADVPAPGFVSRSERLWGIGAYGTTANDVRVYYSRWRFDRQNPNSANEYNEIWSVALDVNGEFIPASEKREIKLPLYADSTGSEHFSSPVSDIEFSANGDMLCGERTMRSEMGECGENRSAYAHRSRILEYRRDVSGFYTNPFIWHKVGLTYYSTIPYKTNSSGGVDFGYGISDSVSGINSDCDSIIVGSGDFLFYVGPNDDSYVYGLQVTDRSSAGAIDVQDFSHYIDLNETITWWDKTEEGDVDVFRRNLCGDTTCMAINSDTTYCDSTGTYIYEFTVRNNSPTKSIEQLEITVDSPQPPEYVVTMPGTLNISPPVPPLGVSGVQRVKLVGPGAVATAEVCYTLSAHFVHDDCPWCCFIENCIKLPICGTCAEVIQDSIYCSNGNYFYNFTLQNGTIYDVTKIQLTSPGTQGITFVPQTFHFTTPIAPGQVFPNRTAQILGGAAGMNFPVRIKLFSGNFECCYFELPYTLPLCDTLQLNLVAFIQGRYDQSADMMFGDTIEVELRNTSSPYALVEKAKGYLNDSGKCSLNFRNALNDVYYYIVLKHRNSIETWSMSPGQHFSAGVLNFNFLQNTQAYGQNMALIDFLPYSYGILTGDVNQDGIIDAEDLGMIDNDAINFSSGYVNTDLNGDGFVDVTDISIADNNAFNLVTIVRP